MLYVFYGNDVIRVRKSAHEFLNTYEVQGATVRDITVENYDAGLLRELAGASPLFGPTPIVRIDTLSEDGALFEGFIEDVPMLATSQNIFVVIERALTAVPKKIFTTHATAIHEKTKEKEKQNNFELADALLRRDRKSIWILFIEARRRGEKTEALIGMLLWQIKLLRLADRTKTATEAGQSEYPYNKAKRALSKFKHGEVDEMSRQLLAIYHDGHAGKRDINLALESWVLKV